MLSGLSRRIDSIRMMEILSFAEYESAFTISEIFGFGKPMDGPAGSPGSRGSGCRRAITDFLTALVVDKLFDRFPGVRVASVENGAGFVPALLKDLRTLGAKLPGYFTEDPAETFRRHVWINPFWEDDLDVLIEAMGPDRIMFGSDWPHVEGLPHPLDYLTEVEHLDESLQRRIMHDNAAALMTPTARR